jgi:hypothetical protein
MWRGPNASRTSSPSSAPIRAEGNRLVESRNDPRGAFPGIDQPSQPEPGVECFRRDSENPPFPSEELEVTLVVLALTENVPKVPRRLVAIAGVRPSKKNEQPKTRADTHQRRSSIRQSHNDSSRPAAASEPAILPPLAAPSRADLPSASTWSTRCLIDV